MWNRTSLTWLSLGLMVFLTMGCDPLRKKKCEWYMVPEPKHSHLVESGWVSLCLTNYVLDRQKCYVQAKLGLAEKMYGKPFRYSELELDSKVFPKAIEKVVECTPDPS